MRLIDADAFIKYLGLNSQSVIEKDIKTIVTLEDFDRQPIICNIDMLIMKLEKHSRSNICNSYDICPYLNKIDVHCEHCGALGALEIVKSEMEKILK